MFHEKIVNKNRFYFIIGLLIVYCLSFGPMFFCLGITKSQIPGFPVEEINTLLNYFYLPHLLVAYEFEPYCRYYMFCLSFREGPMYYKEAYGLLFDPKERGRYDDLHLDFRMRFWSYVNGPLVMSDVTYD